MKSLKITHCPNIFSLLLVTDVREIAFPLDGRILGTFQCVSEISLIRFPKTTFHKTGTPEKLEFHVLPRPTY